MKELIETTLEEARQTLESFLEETTTVGIISQAASTCAEALKAGNKIISCGNGGSLCDATHFAEELTGRYIFRKTAPNIASVLLPKTRNVQPYSQRLWMQLAYTPMYLLPSLTERNSD